MSELTDHARREFGLIAENPVLIDLMVQLVAIFETWNTIPGPKISPTQTIGLLLDHKPLTPLTDDPAEWEPIGNKQTHSGNQQITQNIRNPRALSDNGGKTYWLYDPNNPTKSSALYPTRHVTLWKDKDARPKDIVGSGFHRVCAGIRWIHCGR